MGYLLVEVVVAVWMGGSGVFVDSIGIYRALV